MRITASDVARWAGGTLIGADADADGASFDTRTLAPGEFFVAVRGERDGHDHVGRAIASGASFVLVEKGRCGGAATCVEVDDTVEALGRVAAHARESLGGAVVAITGSVGKTSTKNLVGAVVLEGFDAPRIAAGSFNNDLGVPVTILSAPGDCDVLVLEMGMRGHGEIARLCGLARPTIGVVTSIGDAHSERVGGIEGVARAKGELLESLPAGGTAVLNLDDPWEPVLRGRLRDGVGVVTFGSAMGADVRWSIQSRDESGRALARFEHRGASAEAVVPFPGDHMVANAAAAVATGIALDMPLSDCVAALASATGEPGRMRWTTSRSGARILDDSYNANVSSMTAAIDTLARIEAPVRVAVLGAMAEVEDPAAAHAAVAAHASAVGVEVVALETDLYGVPALDETSVVAAIEAFGDGAVVLVKGSRASRTERIVAALGG